MHAECERAENFRPAHAADLLAFVVISLGLVLLGLWSWLGLLMLLSLRPRFGLWVLLCLWARLSLGPLLRLRAIFPSMLLLRLGVCGSVLSLRMLLWCVLPRGISRRRPSLFRPLALCLRCPSLLWTLPLCVGCASLLRTLPLRFSCPSLFWTLPLRLGCGARLSVRGLDCRAILRLIGDAAWRMRHTVTRCCAAYFSGLSRRPVARNLGAWAHLGPSTRCRHRMTCGLHDLESRGAAIAAIGARRATRSSERGWGGIAYHRITRARNAAAALRVASRQRIVKRRRRHRRMCGHHLAIFQCLRRTCIGNALIRHKATLDRRDGRRAGANLCMGNLFGAQCLTRLPHATSLHEGVGRHRRNPARRTSVDIGVVNVGDVGRIVVIIYRMVIGAVVHTVVVTRA